MLLQVTMAQAIRHSQRASEVTPCRPHTDTIPPAPRPAASENSRASPHAGHNAVGRAPIRTASPATLLADQWFRDRLVALIPSLRTFARGLCGRRDLADDLAQEAMLRGWAARASFTPGTNFRAWMFTILRNQFYAMIRKNRRISSWDPDIAERVLVEAASQQDTIHIADVVRALQKLPPEQREVLLLIGANGTSYKEAAAVIGVAIGTIKSRLARGRKALALLIDGPDDPDLTGNVRPVPAVVSVAGPNAQAHPGRAVMPG